MREQKCDTIKFDNNSYEYMNIINNMRDWFGMKCVSYQETKRWKDNYRVHKATFMFNKMNSG